MSIADELDPEVVEAAARAAFDVASIASNSTWELERSWQKSIWRRIALAAIATVAADIWEEGRIAGQNNQINQHRPHRHMHTPYREDQ